MPAPVTINEFLELTRQSSVVDAALLTGYLNRLQAADVLPISPAKLAGFMVRDGLLTPFQAQRLLEGKWRGFIMSGKYRVLEHVGSGGMGSVYLCEHLFMKRRVALKVLPASQAQDPGLLERFYREARAAAALNHANIVRTYDIDQEDKHHFLVMEYVDGTGLQELVEQHGPLAIPRACHYIRQAALGLQRAHQAGLVHRDIKPANLLVDRGGVVKILDMGLARFFREDDDNLTRQHEGGAVLGTADYLAPEQAVDSHTVDTRADIYSLGGTFYFLLTGRKPFHEGTAMQKLIWHQVRQIQPVQELRPEVPKGVAAVLDKMMAKDPAERYQLPIEVAEALVPWTEQPVPPPSEAEMPRLCPALRAAGATALPADAIMAQPDPKTRDEEPPLGSSSPSLTAVHRDPRTGANAGDTRRSGLEKALAISAKEVSHPTTPARTARWFWVAGLALLSVAAGVAGILVGWPGVGKSNKSDEAARALPDATLESPSPKRSRSREIVKTDPAEPAPAKAGPMEPAPIPGPLLRLTDGGLHEARSAFYSAAVNVQDFTTAFTFQIARDSHEADGFTFCIQGNHAGSLGGIGGDLGYGGIEKSLAIKFGIYKENATGLLLNGEKLQGDGAVPFSSNIDLHSGRVYHAVLTYHGKTLLLQITDSQDAGNTFSHEFGPIDIPATVGGATAFVGFTGGTGGLAAKQDILNWHWLSDLPAAKDLQPDYRKGFSSQGLTLNGGAEIVYPPGQAPDKDPALRHLSSGELVRLKGPAPSIRTAMSSDGKLGLSANGDGTVSLWQLEHGRELRRFQRHSQGAASYVSFSQDGRRAVSSGQDGTARLWDVASAWELSLFEGHQGIVWCAVLSPNGKQLLTGGDDQTARLWNVDTDKEIRRFNGHTDAVKSVAFSPDGLLAVTASRDRTVRLWDVESGKELRRLKGHTGGVNSVVLTPDGTRALSGSDDTTLRLWDLTTGKEIRTLRGTTMQVWTVALAGDGRHAVSGGQEHCLRYWDIDRATLIRTFVGHDGEICGVAVSADGRLGLTGSTDWTVRAWDLHQKPVGESLRLIHRSPVDCVAVSPDGRRALTGCWQSPDNLVHFWDLTTGKELRTLAGHTNDIHWVRFSADGRQGLSASADKTVRLWDLEAGKEIARLEGHESYVRSAVFSADGRQVLTGSVDKSVRLWDLASRRELIRCLGHTEGVTDVVFSATPGRAFSSSWDQTIREWDLATGKEVRRLEGHQSGVWNIALASDGRHLWSCSMDGTVRLWDGATGKEIRQVLAHPKGVRSLALAPDGTRFLTGCFIGEDRTVRLWNLATGRELYRFAVDATEIHSLTFSPDGRSALCGCRDNVARVFILPDAPSRPFELMGVPTWLCGWFDDRMAALMDGGR